MHTEFDVNRDYLHYLNIMVDKIESEHLSVFAGAGVSINSGFVDWKGLMKPIIDQLNVSPDMDLALAAQFYVNEFERNDINDLIINEFNRPAGENKIMKLLGTFPIKSYWTTNYDSIIEDTLSHAPINKTVDLKINKDQFKYHIPDHDVTVYKMHGDRCFPDEAIITKNDYEVYDTDREVFTKALFTELITNSFLFIGFSFSDPNLDRILSIVKHTFDNNSPQNHYCFMRAVCRTDYDDHRRFLQDRNFQKLRIKEMRRYGIQTILVSDYDQILVCLEYIRSRLEQRRVFVAGTIVGGAPINSPAAVFIQQLAQELVSRKYKIVTGFGETIGSYLLVGACAKKNVNEARQLHRAIEIYPLAAGGEKIPELRKELISSCGSFIALFGKKEYSSYQDDAITADGLYEEFTIAEKLQKTLIPVGCTGYTSKRLWEYADSQKELHPKPLDASWKALMDKSYSDCNSVIDAIIKLIEYRNVQQQKKLEVELLRVIGQEATSDPVQKNVFLSFHYDSSHQVASEMRTLIDATGRYIATEEEEAKPQSGNKMVFEWIDQKLINTFATLLIFDASIFDSQFVAYEIFASQKRNNTIVVICKKEDLESSREVLKKKYQLDDSNAVFRMQEEIMSPDDISKMLEALEKDREAAGLESSCT